MNKYSIFDINIVSDIKFKNIPLSNSQKYELRTITVNKSPIDKKFKLFRTISLRGEKWVSFFNNCNEFAIRFHNYADFTISTKEQIVTSFKRKSTNDTTLTHLITDHVLPYALTLMGKMVFHSSTVSMGDEAISFQAPSGSGKSSLAAYFCMKNYNLLTDDSLLLEEKNKSIYAYPSYPGIRLWPNNIKNIFTTGIESKKVSQLNSKRLINSKIDFNNDIHNPVRLKAIYFINNCNHTDIEELNPSEGFSLIIKNIFRLNFDNKEINKRQFEFINKILTNTAIYKLNYEKKCDSLEKVYNLVTNQNFK